MKRVILASGSPRRKALLESAGVEFDIIVSDVDEDIEVAEPAMLVKELALLKAAAVAKTQKQHALVIGADTVVSVGGKILGKPNDGADAKRMLNMLSGRAHQVYTGVCVVDSKSGVSVSMHQTTNVVFKPLTRKQIRDYVATKEPLDKAGAYGIQGLGGRLVKYIIGDYNNIVGMPVELLLYMLDKEFDFKVK